MPTLLRVLESLTPLVVLVAVGAALLRFGFVSDAVRRQADRLVYWVCLPALLMAKVGEAGRLDGSIAKVVAAMAGVTLVAAGASWAAWRALGGASDAMGVMVQGGSRGNLAFVGLPVIALGGGGPRAVAIAAIVIAPTVVLYNVIAVGALTWGKRRSESAADGAAPPRLSLGGLLRPMATNPLIVACTAGVAVAASGWTPPTVVLTSLDLVGQPAAPLALMSLGGALVVYRVRGRLVPASVVAAVKLALCPLLAGGLAYALRLDPQEAMALLVLAATPSAVAGYVLVTQVGGDEGLAASVIAVTTLGSVVSLGAALGVASAWPL